MESKINYDKIADEKLAKWIVKQHFSNFSSAGIKELVEFYIGVYSSRPTSWMVIMARNMEVTQENAITMEESPKLVRVPGMRRSKFLLSKSIASIVFNATRLSISEHEWRLRDVKLTIEDYYQILPLLKELAQKGNLYPKVLQEKTGWNSEQVRACITVASYEGILIRIPSTSIWSCRWSYKSIPNDFFGSYEKALADRDKFIMFLIRNYIENYGPVRSEDIVWWLGINKGQVTSLLKKIDIVELSSGMWIGKKKKIEFEQFIRTDWKEKDDIVRFLPAWDPFVMGYAPDSMQRACMGLHSVGAYDAFGNGKPIVLVGSKAVGTWEILRNGSKRELKLKLSNISESKHEILKCAALDWSKRIGITYNVDDLV